eukprot:366018-Chlamydomonas_euryale.AAC.14
MACARESGCERCAADLAGWGDWGTRYAGARACSNAGVGVSGRLGRGGKRRENSPFEGGAWRGRTAGQGKQAGGGAARRGNLERAAGLGERESEARGPRGGRPADQPKNGNGNGRGDSVRYNRARRPERTGRGCRPSTPDLPLPDEWPRTLKVRADRGRGRASRADQHVLSREDLRAWLRRRRRRRRRERAASWSIRSPNLMRRA